MQEEYLKKTLGSIKERLNQIDGRYLLEEEGERNRTMGEDIENLYSLIFSISERLDILDILDGNDDLRKERPVT